MAVGKWIQTALGVVVLVVLPIALSCNGSLGLVATWPVWVTILAGSMVHLNAPHTPVSNLFESNSRDRGSTYLMIAATAFFSIVSVSEYGCRMSPVPFLSPASGVGIFLLAAGLFLRWWTIHTLGEYFTARVSIEDEHEIVAMGPYKALKLRHPAYSGTLLVCLGIPVVLRSYWGLGIVLAVVIPVYLYRIYVEETALHQKMGDKYNQFRQSTYSLIPLLF